jgi:hypothetical protein
VLYTSLTTLTCANVAGEAAAMAAPQDSKPTVADVAEDGTRASRETYAARRIRKMVAGWPPFTDEQRAKLAAILWPGEDSEAGT